MLEKLKDPFNIIPMAASLITLVPFIFSILCKSLLLVLVAFSLMSIMFFYHLIYKRKSQEIVEYWMNFSDGEVDEKQIGFIKLYYARKYLLKLIKPSQDKHKRQQAIGLLPKVKGPNTLSFAKRIFKDDGESNDVRAKIILIFPELLEHKDMLLLLKEALGNKSIQIVNSAIKVLSSLSGESYLAFEALLDELKSQPEDHNVLMNLLDAIGENSKKYRYDKVIRILKTLLMSNEYPKVLVKVVEIIVTLDGIEGTKALKSAFEHYKSNEERDGLYREFWNKLNHWIPRLPTQEEAT